ncbi:MAG: xanthine dehydrogenase family protein molybdopterin-binding subunit [Actinomycetota bacterium]
MSMIGTRVVRKEDPALLTVGGDFVADVGPTDAVQAVFVRSVMAHGEILSIDTDEARAMPGVVAVYTAEDLGLQPQPPGNPMLNATMTRTALATDRVRYVGEPYAVVLAETLAQAIDAAEMIWADIDPLDAVVTISDSMAEELLLFPEAGTNRSFTMAAREDADVTDGCEVVVELSMHNPRLSGAPIEPRAAVAEWIDGRLTQWSCTQFPHRTRDGLAAALGLEHDDVRVITPDVGGGFGAKGGTYPEDIVTAAAAKAAGRPVRWVETRSESMTNLAHGRSLDYRLKLGGTRDGRIEAYSMHIVQDAGAYPAIGSVLPMFGRIMATGTYDIERVSVSAESVVTNTTPVGAYRGAGRPEATLAIERMLDVFAAEVGMDPAAVRRRNFIAPEAFPFTTPTGADMDSGEYAAALDKVAEAADLSALRADQAERLDDASRPLLGIGWSAYVEITNPVNASEFGSCEIRPDGSALLLTGSSAHGQGHHTTFAQLASELTGIPVERIEVRHGDTAEVKRGGGTGGSRSLQVGGTAIWQATEAVVERAKEIAADVLEANPADIVLDTGTGEFSVTGSPTVGVGWAAVAAHATEDDGEPLAAETDFQPPAATFPFGVHLSVVEVDRDTGEVTLVRHVACDDAGVIVNPTIVDGQVHGGIGGGVGQALMEEFVYDEWGNPQTGNFMDYAIPAASEFPSFDRIPMETPTDRNPLGVKGIGEAGTIGSTPAVQNAVVDALKHLGITHIEIPVKPMRVWRAIQEASA